MEYKIIGSYLIIDVGAELDHHQADIIQKEIEKIKKERKYVNLVLDFSKTEFMDSSGVGLIIRQYKYLSMYGGNVCISGLTSNIEKLFYISGLHKIIRTYSNVEDVFNEK